MLGAVAASEGLYISAVHDAGRTEVAPGTNTCLAIGFNSNVIDTITGHLKLYK